MGAEEEEKLRRELAAERRAFERILRNIEDMAAHFAGHDRGIALSATRDLILNVRMSESGQTEAPPSFDWSDKDPRWNPYDLKSVPIIILTEDGKVLEGVVETKHGYSIQLVKPPSDSWRFQFIDEKENWPVGWRWILKPPPEKKA